MISFGIHFRLPPLIEPIALDYKVCVCPFIDVIDAHDYSYQGIREGTRGTFDWKFGEFGQRVVYIWSVLINQSSAF